MVCGGGACLPCLPRGVQVSPESELPSSPACQGLGPVALQLLLALTVMPATQCCTRGLFGPVTEGMDSSRNLLS